MLWRVQSRHLLLSSEIWATISKSASSNFRKHRYLSTVNQEEQTSFWDTSWLEKDLEHKDDAAQPQSTTALPVSSPETSVGRGVDIDKRGQLSVVSHNRAKKRCCTILIISAASTSLTRADFTRLWPEKHRKKPWAMECPCSTSFT